MMKIVQTEEQYIHKWSVELLELFENVLCVKPECRWTVPEVLECPWVKMQQI